MRFLPNPYYIAELKECTGLEEAVRAFLFGYRQTTEFMRHLEELFAFLLPQYVEEGKSSLVIAVGCTGGHHRSVAVAHALTEFIRPEGISGGGNPPGHQPIGPFGSAVRAPLGRLFGRWSFMSFAGEVKAELCRGKLGRKCCAQAEACGVLLYCNRFSLSEVKIVTESPAFAQRLPGLFRKAFGVEFDEKGDPDTPGKRIFTISAPEKLALLWELCAFDPSGPAHHINFGMLEETHCRLAFLRGAFLAGGSVTDPQKGYHLELATTHLR